MSEVEHLIQIVRTLRSPEGCPWDRVQTHESLKATCMEEAAEVIAGINILQTTKDPANLKEELGDLLLQIVFHAVIAEEEGLFSLEDVAGAACDKMIRRHPHVFSGVTYVSAEERHAAWDRIKRQEKEGHEWEEAYLKEALCEAHAMIDKAQVRKGFKD